MDVSQALTTAGNIMLLGMGCVFVFLGMLVIGLNILAKLASRVEDQQPVTVATPGGSSQVTPDVVAAISAAVHQYRSARTGAQKKIQ